MKRYIIISIKHGTAKTPMFWRAENKGYTYSPFAAGIYTENEINSDSEYYNNGESTIAVELSDSAFDEIGLKMYYSEIQLNKYYKKSLTKTNQNG